MQQRTEGLQSELQELQSAHAALQATSDVQVQDLQKQLTSLTDQRDATKAEAAHRQAELEAVRAELQLLQSTSAADLKSLQDTKDAACTQLEV